MRLLILMTIASFVLAGCMTVPERDLPYMKVKYETADAAKEFITPELVKDCADKLAKEFPHVTIIGNFSVSPAAALKVGDLQMLPGSGPNDEIVALVAPTTNKNIFGGDNKAISGCSYRLHDNQFTFRAVHGPASFGRVRFVRPRPPAPAQ